MTMRRNPQTSDESDEFDLQDYWPYVAIGSVALAIYFARKSDQEKALQAQKDKAAAAAKPFAPTKTQNPVVTPTNIPASQLAGVRWIR